MTDGNGRGGGVEAPRVGVGPVEGEEEASLEEVGRGRGVFSLVRSVSRVCLDLLLLGIISLSRSFASWRSMLRSW